MKIYFHLNILGFSNCYIVVDEKTSDAIIIDPGKITTNLISQIEDNNLKLSAILITHNHGSHVQGLKTLQKIYFPKIYAADWDVAQNETRVLTGDGKLRIGKMVVHYMTVPGHTADSVVYKIGNILFTGDTLSASNYGETNSSYSEYILKSNVNSKIFSQQDITLVMPGHGPPTTLESLKKLLKY